MPVWQAIILGITQGLAEFLPISSSGHLILVPWLFGWDSFGDNASLNKTFDVALHLGTLAGVVAYFGRDLWRIVAGGIAAVFHPRTPGPEGRLAWLLLLSAVPAAITGALFSDIIEENLSQVWLVAVMLIVFAFVLEWADHLGGRRPADRYGWKDALIMGIGQALALQPGVSRSGVTITVGLVRGFTREAAARLSFLMSIPVIAGAVTYKAVDVFTSGGVPPEYRAAFVAGIISAGLTGWVAVWGTLAWVRTRTFRPFVIYRIVVGVAVLLLIATGVRPAT